MCSFEKPIYNELLESYWGQRGLKKTKTKPGGWIVLYSKKKGVTENTQLGCAENFDFK